MCCVEWPQYSLILMCPLFSPFFFFDRHIVDTSPSLRSTSGKCRLFVSPISGNHTQAFALKGTFVTYVQHRQGRHKSLSIFYSPAPSKVPPFVLVVFDTMNWGLYRMIALWRSVANIFVRSVSWCLFTRDCVHLGTVRKKTRVGESWRDEEHVYTATKYHNDELCKLSTFIYK
jgi:hypothetical protein